MVRCTFLFVLMLFPMELMAQNNDFLHALFESQEKLHDTKPSIISQSPRSSTDSNDKGKMSAPALCTSNMQTSLPLRAVLALLRGEGATLSPSYDANSGKLSINGGPMIGNCNSMLEFHLNEPTEDLPYTFEVRIKRPSGCSEGKCAYNVQTIKDNQVVNLDRKIELEPNYNGFINCLKQTGVFVDGKIDKNNIVNTELNVEKSGVNVSGEVWYVSRGPEAINTGGGVFSDKNKYPNSNCNFYEDIKKEGYSVYTKEDISKRILNEKAISLCKSKNYEEIYSNLKIFESMSSTYKDLEKIAKIQLLKEMKTAKKEFVKAVEKGDLSELDTEKYSKLFKDFYNLIVEKHFNEDAHNNVDENDMSLLVNLYTAYEQAQTQEEKNQLEKKIRDITKEISQYMEDPYFTKEDYKHFISLKNKSPIKDAKWKEATEYMHMSIITLRLSCQAYAVDNKSCSFSDIKDNMKDMASIEKINQRVEGYTKKANEIYSQREYVLKNPDSDNSKEFAKLISNCKNLYNSSNQKQMQYRQTARQYNMVAQQQCRSKNPFMGMFGGYGGYYVKKYQKCVEQLNNSYKAKFEVSKTKLKVCDTQIDNYKDEYDRWKDLEDLRNEYYYGSSQDEGDTKDLGDDEQITYNPRNGSYGFQFNPGQVRDNHYQMPQEFNPAVQYPPMNPYNPNMYTMNRFNGFNGMNSFNSSFGRQPAMFGGGMNWGMGVPWAMQPSINYFTSPGGAFNFSF